MERMRKQIFFMLLFLALVLVLDGSPILADAPRGITGGINFAAPEWGVDRGWIWFNVHEVDPETNLARGGVNWVEYNADDGWRRLSSKVTCVAFGEDVGEDEQTAVFVVQVTRKRGWGPLEPEQYVKFWVRDGGTPGTEGDEWGTPFWPVDDLDDTVPACDYEVLSPDYRVPVSGRNLVLHH
jgi:hypothetical protein